MVKVRRSFLLAALLGAILSWLLTMSPTAAQRNLRVSGDRALGITQTKGYVEIIPRDGRRRQAQQGDRLSNAGDILITGPDSSARLEMDQAIGVVTMAENSRLQVRTLSVTVAGDYLSELFVSQGQVRLRLRPFTNPGTRLEIYTPAGVSGVRGTDFGVSVRLDGQTGIATFEGSVASSAQGQTVMVNALQQSLIRPGEPPTEPVPLTDNPALLIETLRALPGQFDAAGRQLAQVSGSTDFVNLLELNQQQRRLNREGQFDIILPMSAGRRIPAAVITPLGTRQVYKLLVP